MLNKRLIACLILKDNIAVQSRGFKNYFPVGRPEIAVEFLNAWGIDEIIVMDIDASMQNRTISPNVVKNISRVCFVPLTVAGGIGTVADAGKLINSGADKICINTAAIRNPGIISNMSAVFGSQSVVLAVDVLKTRNIYRVYSRDLPAVINPIRWLSKAEKLGAGEILITSVNRDGMKQGYDINLIRKVSSSVRIPVIANGGAGHPGHFRDVFVKGGACGAAAANYFHFTEHSVAVTKSYLLKSGLRIRRNEYIQYDVCHDSSGRISKHDEVYLDKLRFVYHPREEI